MDTIMKLNQKFFNPVVDFSNTRQKGGQKLEAIEKFTTGSTGTP